MPRDGAILFGDLIGKLDVLRVACDCCHRAGSYRVARLIEQHGRDAAIVDWLDKIVADCPRLETLQRNLDNAPSPCNGRAVAKVVSDFVADLREAIAPLR